MAPLSWAGKEYRAAPQDEVVPNQILVHLKHGAAPASVIPVFIPGAQISSLLLPDFYVVSAPSGLPAGATAQLAAHPLVEAVEPDRVRRTTLGAPTDPYYLNSTSGDWELFNTQALQAWNFMGLQYLTASTAGTGRIKVAVLDTGADCTHPDFMNAGGSSTDAAAGGQLVWSASQALVATTLSSPACAWQDDQGHGTHVTGILAAATSNGAGVAALGFPLQVIEFKVLNSAGSGTDSTIANAIVAAVGAGARVISMSLGGTGYSQTLQTAINYAWQNNVVVVAAAGNNYGSSLVFPGDANHAVAVSATDINSAFAPFSDYGNAVAVAAPGVSIWSTIPTYTVPLGCCNYAALSGTSMSTPLVSALAGLLATANPGTSAAAIVQRIEQTAISSGTAWNQNFGYGVINAYHALAAVGGIVSSGGVSGQVVDSSGNSITGAQVAIGGQIFTTDSSGLYWIRPLAPGSYPVTVSASGYTSQSLSVVVAAGADSPLTVSMGVSYGSFTGRVTDQGAPVSGAIVQALSSGQIAGTAITAGDGTYQLWVPAGSGYAIQVSQAGGNTVALSSFMVTAGASTTVNLTISSKLGAITGAVQDTNSNLLAGAQITLTSSTYSASTTTGTSGNYSFTNLSPGTYSVTASATGDNPATQTAIVSADAATALNFQLSPLPTAAPTFIPPGGLYAAPTSVAISSATPGASIRYTTDGSTPSETAGALYTGPVAVAATATLNGIAYSTGRPDSAVVSANYTINSSSWYNSAWGYRKPLTINHAQVSGSSSLTNFPVLISITDANLQASALANGNDILFTAGDGVTKLNHEIESYNSATGQLVAWVNVPAVSPASDTALFLYYGNPGAANQQNPSGVWDSNYKGVWHFNSGGVDSTAAQANATFTGSVTAAAGQIGGAQAFDGSTGYGKVTKVVTDATSGTYEAWVYSTNAGYFQGMVLEMSSSNYTQNYLMLPDLGGTMTVYGSDYGPHSAATSHFVFPANTWVHLVGTYSNPSPASSTVSIYVNGQLVQSSSFAYNVATLAPVSYVIGAGPNGAGVYNDYFPGRLDEVRYSTVARSADWILTEYRNQSAPGTFVSVGAQQGQAAAPVSVTVASSPAGLSVTVDGTACTAPCSFEWSPGSSHTLAAAAQGNSTTQYVFANWSDGGAATHTVTGPSSPATYTATFTTQYYLTTGVSPSGEGTISPAGGWYNAASVVPVSAAANAGYQFTGFSGALTGATTPQNLTLNGPATVTANFAAASSGPAWYNSAWGYRKPLTINHAQVSGSSNLATFPVLISIIDANLKANASTNGNDILFTAADGVTKLNHEIESYNSATGQLVAWVNVPAVSPATDTALFLYYGNPAVASQQNVSGVWDSNYKGVWHFNSGGADSTAAQANATFTGSVTAAAGQIGGAEAFDGSTGYGTVSNVAAGTTSGTYEAWVYSTNAGYFSGTVLGMSNVNYARNDLMVTDLGGGMTVYGTDFGPHTAATSHFYFPANTWVHLVGTYTNPTANSSTVNVYVNGTLVSSTNFTFNVAANVPLRYLIGAGPNGAGVYNDYFPGRLDEVRYSTVARSADWILTEYRNQSAPGTFVSVGAQQGQGSGSQGDGTQSVTVASSPAGLTLTVDGVACTAPCSFQWTPGSSHTLAAASQGNSSTQYGFASWSDGGAATHTVTAPSSPATYTASFTMQYYLTTAVNPPVGGSISPASGWYNAGSVVSLSATANTNYQFTGFSGALTGVSVPQSVTVSAPLSVTANMGGISISGCTMFPSNNIWNTPIDQLPVDANSAAYIATIGASKGLHPDFSSTGGGIPFIVVPGTQPFVPIVFGDGASESDSGPYPVPANAPIEGGSSSTGDRHVLVLDSGNCTLYEMYSAYPQSDGSWTASSGAVFDLTSNTLRPAGWTSTDAAGFAILPGLVRYDEVASGQINHAIRMTVPQTRDQYIWPARHYASSLTGTQYPPMGQRFRLKASFDITPYPPDVQVILTALKKYGMFLADNGSSWYLTGAPDPRWDDTTLHQLGQILGSNIEAVDESSLMIDPNSAAAQ